MNLLPAHTERPPAPQSVQFKQLDVKAELLDVGDVVMAHGRLARIAAIGAPESSGADWLIVRRAQIQYLDTEQAIEPYTFGQGFTLHRVYGGPKLYAANRDPRCVQRTPVKVIWRGLPEE